MEEIAIKLSFQERELIIQQHTIDADLLKKLQIAEIQENNLIVRLSLDYLEDLVDYIAAEANHVEDKKVEEKLEKLYTKLYGIIKSYQ